MSDGCLVFSDGYSAFSGKFKRGGVPTGNAKATFSYDLGTIEGSVSEDSGGSFEGKTRIFHRDGSDKLQFVGLYSGGRPSGPGWILPFDPARDGVVYATFKHGQIDGEVVHIGPSLQRAFSGRLINGSWIEDPREVKIVAVEEARCVKSLRFADLADDDEERPSYSPHRLPVFIATQPDVGRVIVRSAKTLIFNRVAKTGSQSFAELLVQLEKQRQNGVETKIMLSQGLEQLMEPPALVADFVAAVDGGASDAAWVRHYNFVNFERFGSLWTPNYINIVRHPVDRVTTRN